MPKMEIYEPTDQPEKITRLRLLPWGQDDREVICLAAVNERGELESGGLLLKIYKDTGTMERWAFVNPRLGFRLDERQRVVLEGED